MSNTPRMKAAQMAAIEHGTGDVYRVGCDIERELNADNEMFRKLNIHTLNLVDRIKRLEEAGDRMAIAYEEICFDRYDDEQIANWHKAKEAKL